MLRPRFYCGVASGFFSLPIRLIHKIIKFVEKIATIERLYVCRLVSESDYYVKEKLYIVATVAEGKWLHFFLDELLWGERNLPSMI